MKRIIEDASIKRDGDNDSDNNSSSEEKEVENSARKATTTEKSTMTSGKMIELRKPSTIDCDKDHRVSAKDDNMLSGVLVFRSCYALPFEYNSSRCKNVERKMTSLLTERLKRLGFKEIYDVNITSVDGYEQETYFGYQVLCPKTEQHTVIEQLKDVCRDKNLADIVTYENRVDGDDSSS